MKYKVTTEIKTPLYRKILRYFNLLPKIATFTLILNDDFEVFGKDDILFGGQGKIKIIEKL